MKIQVLHDEQGNILSFAVVKTGTKDGLSLVPKPNQSIKVVTLPDIKGKLNNEKTFMRLVETMNKHKVDTSSEKGKLIRKSA
ncbi:MAG: hypothetical protein QG670_679 [Thermoproteota archaeon]|nr:hypothetical protein [Thermoproteota archaeon]